MSGKGTQKGGGASGSGGGGAPRAECPNECGYDPSNKRHEESYWEGITDPRDYPDSHMKFNSIYYRMIDRQIAANHSTECLGGKAQGGNNSGASSGSKK